MDFSLEDILRPNIRTLAPYSCARDEYKGDDAIFLDANENPYDTGYNRYPDPMQMALKGVLSSIKGVDVSQMLLGNGSDEIIDILIRSVCSPASQDNIITFIPGYSMYEVCANINDVKVHRLSLREDFLPDVKAWKETVDAHTKITFICSPNNPIGTAVPMSDIEMICKQAGHIVMVDEAYVDFSAQESAVSLLDRYPNLVVLQTLSKAWGMAGLRLGMCFASREMISVLNKVKPPYNVSSLTQKTAIEQLSQFDEFESRRREILSQRDSLYQRLCDLDMFTHVYPSDANFILVRHESCNALYRFLTEHRMVVRKRDIPPLISGGIRITVGTPQENDTLIDLLKKYRDMSL